MTTTLLLWALLVPLLIALGVLLWLTEDRKTRARRWRRQGMTQDGIAHRLGVSRTTVRRWIATQ
jgi:DNA invertase Pin-like site-specific DNA recombinase